jgi:small subunit ribosomal protein S35
MPFDQDWPTVWPTTRSFHPATVPLPLHMGHVKQPHIASPGKFANAELMKIINFLHLTPPAIKRQCESIKSKFVTSKFTSVMCGNC